jgi:two-component system chemotaxis sensor kinase CheA
MPEAKTMITAKGSGKNDQTEPRNGSVKVNLKLLDTLMTLAGELVLSRNQLVQSIGSANSRDTELSSQRIDTITSELQEAVMKTRMQPIAKTLNSFSRIVRDRSRALEKQVDLVIDGKDVELDRSILESISDPLIRVVKNAVDHGIEPPLERTSSGKHAKGTIIVKAFHDAGQVHIRISDDGCGMPCTQSDRTTGLDMDEITAIIEGLGGVVELSQEKGIGTHVHIKLPLTLAIIPSQITRVGGERYAIPQVNLDELLRIPVDQVKDKIEKVGDSDVVRLRGELLPVIDLAKILGIDKIYTDPETGRQRKDRRRNIADRRSRQHLNAASAGGDGSPDSNDHRTPRQSGDRRSGKRNAVNIAVVSSGTHRYGLVVDELNDSEEIVVKPVGRYVKTCTAFAGATIMGDGKVALILDINNIAQMAKLAAIAETAKAVEDSRDTANDSEKTSLLTFKNAENEFVAVPLDNVERIERIETRAIESIGSNRVIQYRGGTLVLTELSQLLGLSPFRTRDTQELIVIRSNDRETGLMVNPPLDTANVYLELDDTAFNRPGVMGSMVIKAHTTLILDPDKLADLVDDVQMDR